MRTSHRGEKDDLSMGKVSMAIRRTTGGNAVASQRHGTFEVHQSMQLSWLLMPQKRHLIIVFFLVNNIYLEKKRKYVNKEKSYVPFFFFFLHFFEFFTLN